MATLAGATPMRSPAPSHAPGATDAEAAPGQATGTALICLVMAVIEAAGIAAGVHVGGLAGFGGIIGLHLAVLACLGWHLRARQRAGRDTVPALVALLTTAAVGPLGALGAAGLALASGRGRGRNALLEAWYERISLSVAVDPVTRFCDDVASGRTIDLGAPAPVSFPSAIANGSLAERQAILGLIARQFHPDYLPALKLALLSPEPVIRVQAAAVAAHIRPRLSALFKETLAAAATTAGDPEQGLLALRRLDGMIASGLLDEGDRRRGVEATARLGEAVLARLGPGGAMPAVATSRSGQRAPLPIEDALAVEGMLERLLLARGQHATLRYRRSRRRVLTTRPRARIRRLSQAPRREAGA